MMYMASIVAGAIIGTAAGWLIGWVMWVLFLRWRNQS